MPLRLCFFLFSKIEDTGEKRKCTGLTELCILLDVARYNSQNHIKMKITLNTQMIF